jgi:2-polyprenyl-3-methyl-5-hydroxy-6-metoxy-1,4-benzoquinol methylase
MKTGNKKYLDPKANKEYYKKSDQNFMPLEQCTMAHKVIDRIAWLVEKVHDLDSRTHIAIGCKDGYEVMTLQAMGVDSVGIDPSEDSILEARHKADQLGYDGRKMFKLGYAEEMPEGLYADTVSCLEVIEHVVDDEKLLKVLSRLGRYVMISTPDANGRHGMEDAKRNEEHVRLYTKEELEKLVSKFGDIKECVIRDDQILILFQPK